MGANESAPDGRQDGEGTVMAAIDDSGATARLVVADISRDDAWLSIPRAEAPTLDEWQ